MEKKVTFQNSQGQKLIGVLHTPDKEGKFPAVIRIHGFASNKEGKSSIGVCKALGEDFVCLRFDLWGHGESDGEFENLTMDEEMDDVKAAINFISKQEKVDPERIGIFGSSLGGMVSIYTAANNPKVKAAAFMCPVSNFKKSFSKKQWQPEKWKETGETFFNNHAGKEFRLRYDFYENGIKYDLYKEAEKIKVPTIIIQGDADTSIPIEDSQELVKHLTNPHLEIIEGCDHHFSNPEHFKTMINKSVEFFKENL